MTEYNVIHNTVHPDRKLTVSTFMMPITSGTGLMTTPPPMLMYDREAQQTRQIQTAAPLFRIARAERRMMGFHTEII